MRNKKKSPVSAWVALLVISALLFVGGLAIGSGDPVESARNSLVRITGEEDVMTMFGPAHVHYSCSGFVLQGYHVLTAAHCIGDKMTADGWEVTKVLKIDKSTDLALIEVNTHGRPHLTIRHDPAKRNDTLYAIGYAFGFTELFTVRGIVQLVDFSRDEESAPGYYLQGAFIGGQSGGPIVDEHGRVVGIVQQSVSGVGYGVGSLIIRAFLVGTGVQA